MYKNYFILNRIVLELNSVLQHSVIREIFSQEKDRLIIKCNDVDEKYIEISVNPGMPYITLKKEYHRAKKNSIDFFAEYLPAEINKIEISSVDRIIRMNCFDMNFYFAIRGKFTNVFMEENHNIINSFKSEDEAYLKEFQKEITGHKFVSDKNIPDFSTSASGRNAVSLYVEEDAEEYRKRYPILGKEIIAEYKFRYQQISQKNLSDYLRQIIEELLTENPAVFISSQANELFLAVKTFRSFPYDEMEVFDSIIDAENFYFSRKFYTDSLLAKRKIIERHLDRELSKLSAKMNDLKGRVDRGSNEVEYNKTGNLLLINLPQIPRKSDLIVLEDIYENNNIIRIKLDPQLTPQQNAEYYFTKAANEKKAYKKSRELLKEISTNYQRLLKIKDNFLSTDSLDDINNIMKELKIKQEEKKNPIDDMQSKFKHYILENKYDVYVGKDSANNDLLTMKFARQNDYWFHARSVPGSHVVLRVINSKEPVPKNILKKTASLAAFHSKAKTSGLATVSFTLKKYVTKKKGMEPGKVSLLKEDVLLVKPEIPPNCEYIEN